jgi:hypothetical protein
VEHRRQEPNGLFTLFSAGARKESNGRRPGNEISGRKPPGHGTGVPRVLLEGRREVVLHNRFADLAALRGSSVTEGTTTEGNDLGPTTT